MGRDGFGTDCRLLDRRRKKKALKEPKPSEAIKLSPEQAHSLSTPENPWSETPQAVADSTGYDQKTPWDIAVQFQNIRRMQGLKDRQKKALQERALAGIFEKVREGLRLPPGKIRTEYLSARELLESGREGEIDFEASDLMALLPEAAAGTKLNALQFAVRGESWPKVLVLLDFSFSMKGEKIATLCLIAAMLALAVPADSLSILGFDSRIHEIKRWDEALNPEQVVERVLFFPGGGFTNMELAFTAARQWVESGRREKRISVLLIGDGKYTEGADPTPLIPDFYKVSVFKVGKDIGGREILRKLSECGKGSFQEARSPGDVPKKFYEMLRDLRRG